MRRFGRANEDYPFTWFRPTILGGEAEFAPLAEKLAQVGSVVDISLQPGLWGLHMIQSEVPLMVIGSKDAERGVDEKHAADLLQAHLIQSLSSARRNSLEFYFLSVSRAWNESQLVGALSVLEMARQEGHVKHLGLAVQGLPLAALGLWQLHDAFDAVVVQSQPAFEVLSPLARERRVPMVVLGNQDFSGGQADAQILEVSRADEIERSLRLGTPSPTSD